MSISSVGQGQVSSTNTNAQVQAQSQQTKASNKYPTNGSLQQTGAQPLNATGRGQLVNLIV